MRRQAETSHRLDPESPSHTYSADEQQPLTLSDDHATSHRSATDDGNGLQQTLSADLFLTKRVRRYVIPTVTVLSLVLAALVYFHYSDPHDEATAPPRFPAVCLTSWEGQWGNIVYQLMFLLSYARRHNLTAYVRPAKPKGSSPQWHGWHITYVDQLYGTQPCPWRQAGAVLQVEYGKREDWGDSMRVPPSEQREGDATLTVHDSSTRTAVDDRSGSGSDRLVVLHRGYYQFHTSGYRPYRDWLTRHMRPKADVEALLLSLWYQLLLQIPADMLLMAVHVRHGDYRDEVGYMFRRIPLQWYYSWIDAWQHNDARYLALSSSTPHDEIKRSLARQQVEQSRARERTQLDELVQPLYTSSHRTFCRPTNRSSSTLLTPPSTSPSLCVLVVSDDPHVSEAFNERGYATATPRDVLSFLSSNTVLSEEVSGWYLDWWLLTRVGVVATSHSSFSHTATLYNVWGGEGSYWRPDPVAMRLTQYEPWDSQYEHHVFKDVEFE